MYVHGLLAVSTMWLALATCFTDVETNSTPTSVRSRLRFLIFYCLSFSFHFRYLFKACTLLVSYLVVFPCFWRPDAQN